jgi:hypothetical protein
MPFPSFRYALGSGGFNYNRNSSDMPSNCMLDGSCNFNLLADSVRSRGGTDVVLTLPERSPITSLSRVIPSSGTSVILSTTESGSIYKDSVALKNDLPKINDASYLEWNDNVIINVGSSVPQVWDHASSTTSDYPAIKMAEDWTHDGAYPLIMLAHGKSNSLRAWALGSTSRPNTLYYSAGFDILDGVPNFSIEDSDEKAGQFVIATPFNEPLLGLIEFGDRLLVFSSSKAFVVDDLSTITTQWGYVAAQWDGGTISHHTLVALENDIFSLTQDGTLYSISAVESYGDYRMASLTEPAAINVYMKENINLTNVADIHLVFDPNIRAIKVFCAPQYREENDIALTYFIDRGSLNGWTPHYNRLFQSGYDARSSVISPSSNGDVNFTGDYFGRIWKIEQPFVVDDGEFFQMQIITPWVTPNFSAQGGADFRRTKRFQNGWVEITNDCPLKIKVELLREEIAAAKEVERITTFFGEAIFDASNWDEVVFGGQNTKQHVRYPIHQITTAIKQVFHFIPLGWEDAARWDEVDFDDEDAIFDFEYEDYAQFEVLSNILDGKSVAQRLDI